MKKLIGLILSLTLIVFAAPAHAFNQPLGINLGFTNFLDGASPGPGWYWTEYFQVIDSEDLLDNDGKTLFDDAHLRAYVNLNQFIYQSDMEFLGGNPGIDVIIPLVDINVDPGIGPFPLNSQDGIGDVLVGPFIQWGPHMIFNRPFFHRFELQVTAPTGDNSDSKVLNPGADVWSINPYYAFTYFITPKLSTSWRIHYLWTEENDDYSELLPGVDVQAGQAIHFNYAVAFALTQTLRLGVAGYYLKQIEDDDYSGPITSFPAPVQDLLKDIEDGEEVFSIGPGMVWHINKDLTFMGAVNFESEAENRPEGVRSTLRLIWKFW